MGQNIPWLKLSFRDPIDRRATRTAIAVLIAIVWVRLFSIPHGDWVVISAFVVSRDSVGNTVWKAKGRMLGTVFGIIAALAFYGLMFRHHIVILTTAFVAVFPFLYLRPSLSNYGYAKFFQQVAFVCFLGALGQDPSLSLLEWRAIDIAIGCAIGVVVSLLILPTWSRPHWRQGLVTAWNDCYCWFEAIIAAYESEAFDAQQLQNLKQTAEASVFKLNQHLASRRYESVLHRKGFRGRALQIQTQVGLIQNQEQIYELLLCLNQTMLQTRAIDRPTLPPEAQALVQQMRNAFEHLSDIIGTSTPMLLPIVLSRYSYPGSVDGAIDLNLPSLAFLLQLNPLCDAIEQYAEIRNEYALRQLDQAAMERA